MLSFSKRRIESAVFVFLWFVFPSLLLNFVLVFSCTQMVHKNICFILYYSNIDQTYFLNNKLYQIVMFACLWYCMLCFCLVTGDTHIMWASCFQEKLTLCGNDKSINPITCCCMMELTLLSTRWSSLQQNTILSPLELTDYVVYSWIMGLKQ